MPRIVYENIRNLKNFYAIEKAGFVTVNELVRDAIDVAIQQGAFIVANVKVVDTYNVSNTITSNVELQGPVTQNYMGWPPLERKRIIANPGAGYAIGDELEFRATAPNLKIKITNTDITTGAVTEFEVNQSGNYTTPVNASKTMTFRVKPNSWSLPVLHKDASFFDAERRAADGTDDTIITNTGNLTIMSNIVSSTGGQPTIIFPSGYLHDPVNANPDSFYSKYGYTGCGNILDPFSTTVRSVNAPSTGGTRWPINGLWTDVQIQDSELAVGQEIFLLPSPYTPSTSNIPPGTIITSIGAFPVIDNTKNVTIAATPYKVETANLYTYFSVNQPITVAKGDKFYVRGNGFSINDSITDTAEKYTVILESAPKIDPLSDANGITGNVVFSDGTGNIRVANLTSGAGPTVWPQVYNGHRMTSLLGPGTVAGPAYVLASTSNLVARTANVHLSVNQTITVNEPVRFRFEQLQPYRLAFDVKDKQTLSVYAATEVQLQNNGNIASVTDYNGDVVDQPGIMGNVPNISANIASIDPDDITQGFVNRVKRVGAHPEAYPLTYTMTLTNRGLFFGISEGSWSIIHKSRARQDSEKDSWFNWFIVQRPVDRFTGKVLTTGQSPVFCVNSVGYKYWKFIVRESDVVHPTQGDKEQTSYAPGGSLDAREVITQYRVPADAHTDDSFALINTTDQIALTEDSKYLISFLYNLTTPRFRYSEELDLVGQTSADVCMAGNDIDIIPYGEARVYKALPANKPYNTGLRIAVLKDVAE